MRAWLSATTAGKGGAHEGKAAGVLSEALLACGHLAELPSPEAMSPNLLILTPY
jgi:hypothetical protein